jgi:D-Tyr-tRNAtyr deacylase
MRAVIQRVKRAEVIINSTEKRKISQGLLILLGIEENDLLIEAILKTKEMLS